MVREQKEPNKRYLILLILSVFILSFSSVQAQPPFSSMGAFPEGITIETFPIEAHQLNTDLEIEMHAHNTSNGVVRTSEDVSCYLDLYKTSDGQELISFEIMSFSYPDFEYFIEGANFSQPAIYSIMLHCNNTVSGGHTTNTFTVNNLGEIWTLSQSLTYIFFILLCILGLYYSYTLMRDYSMEDDPALSSRLYQTKKKSEFLFLMKVLKTKLYMVGIFGAYLILLISSAITSKLMYGLGVDGAADLFKYASIILGWGLIPFVCFWIGFMIVSIVKSVKDALSFEFGGIRR